MKARLIHRLGTVLAVILVASTCAVLGSMAPAHAAPATVTMSGRFVYEDDHGRVIPIRRAHIEMCNQEWVLAVPSGCVTMASGYTDWDGTFTLKGTGNDWFTDLPDPRVKITAESSVATVQSSGAGNPTYCFQSAYKNNAHDGATYQLGDISPASGVSCDILLRSTADEDGAWQLWDDMVEAHQYVRNEVGLDAPPVRVLWNLYDNDASYYRNPIPGDDGAMSIRDADTYNEPIAYDLFGHHLLAHYGEVPPEDFNNGQCDQDTGAGLVGHCLWLPEQGSISWTEGFPDFFAQAVAIYWGDKDRIDLENPPVPAGIAPSDYSRIEGYVAAVLWDVIDGHQDNNDGNASFDRLFVNFNQIWDVLRNYDPPGGNTHPVTIDQFFDGFAQRWPQFANRLSEVFDENRLPGKPAANLRAGLRSPMPTQLPPGSPITVGVDVSNAGTVRPGMGSTVGLFVANTPSGGGATKIGTAPVSDIAPFATTQINVTGTVPRDMNPSFVIVCADSESRVFEASESDNCAVSASIVTEQDAPTIALDAPTKRFTLSTSVHVGWHASDASGVSSFDVEHRTAPNNAGFGAWLSVLQHTTQVSTDVSGAYGRTECFRARATDGVGNVSSFTTQHCTAVPVRASAIKYSGSWQKQSSTAYFGGTSYRTTQHGAKGVRSNVNARELALVATTCSSCGTVDVLWNGTVIGHVNLASAHGSHKRLIPIRRFTSVRQGTVTLRVTSTGKRVEIEGLGISAS
jgi:hypothetical protein